MERSIVTQHSKIEELLTNMEKVIVGKRDTIERRLLLCLLEDMCYWRMCRESERRCLCGR